MINFFRKKRKKLAEDNKTVKYTRYAIGEIVLVVIGILIALSINNWNQQRLNKIRALSFLENLAEDLKSDTIQYNININGYKVDMANNSVIFQNDDYKKLEVDSIVELVSGYWMLNKTSDQTFQKIKNTGIIKLLGDEINKAVNDYYNLDNTYYDYFIEWDRKYSDRDADFWFHNPNFEAIIPKRDFSLVSLPFKDSPAKRKDDLIKLIESTEGRNILRNAILRDEYGIHRVTITKSAAINLLELIEKEISKN